MGIGSIFKAIGVIVVFVFISMIIAAFVFGTGSDDTESSTIIIDDTNSEAVSEETPTPTIETITEPDPIELSGHGPEATQTFELEEGLSIFTMEHNGNSNFIIWLMDGTTGQNIDMLVNEIGSFDGSTAIGITSDDEYLLNIKADGSWTVTIEQPRQYTTESAPIVLRDRGQKATQMIYLDSGLTRFEMVHDGSSNFIVWLMDAEGNKIDLLVNEIGDFEGSKAVGIYGSGAYLLDVTADGDWEIKIE